MGLPKKTIAFNTKSWSRDLDDLGYTYSRQNLISTITNPHLKFISIPTQLTPNPGFCGSYYDWLTTRPSHIRAAFLSAAPLKADDFQSTP